MKNTFTLIALAFLAFTSCKNETTADAPQTEETVTDTAAVASDSVSAAAPVAQPVANPANGSVMTANPQVAAQSYTTTAAPVATAKGMNPPHGQPGHRCDIAVGAPLNSPPGKVAAPAKSTTQSTTITPAMLQNGNLTPAPGANVTTSTPAPATTTTAPVVTAPGMNPPHGQEGHDCSIAVGAPLKK